MLEALRRARGTIDSLVGQIEQMRGMFDDDDGAIAEAVDDADETSAYLAELCKSDTHGGRYTVILRYPDSSVFDDDRNTHGGTYMAHVEADSPEAAFGVAQDEAVAACGERPEDWAVVSVFAGHLQDLFIP